MATNNNSRPDKSGVFNQSLGQGQPLGVTLLGFFDPRLLAP